MHLCILLGLCGPKDAALLRGSVKQQDKVSFLVDLCELALLNRRQSSIQTSATQCLLADVISDAKAILSKQIVLFPADMDPIYATKSTSVPSVDLETLISSTKTELAQIESQLSSLNVLADMPRQHVPRTDIELLKKEVQSQFSRLQNVMVRFEAMYESDVKPWCRNLPDAELIGIGPESSRLLELQQSVLQALSNVKQLKNGYQQIVASETASELTKCDLEINEQAIVAVQEQCSILEKAFARKHEIGVLYG